MSKNIFETTQDWIPIEKIFNNGIIKLKNNKYIKIIKIFPINYNLKSNFEKETILNSYKIFLKTCNFNIQILIQSSKENLEKNIEIINKNLKKENNLFLNNIANEYFDFIKKLNSQNNSSLKNYYIIISNKAEENVENIFQKLNEKYFKIKECIIRCGNNSKDLNNKKEVEELLNIIFNYRLKINN